MTVITVPAEEKMLNELLKQARESGLILEAADGQRFVLVSIENWEGFEVGNGDDFEREVEVTGQNQALLKFLAERRRQGQRIPLTKVKQELGLE